MTSSRKWRRVQDLFEKLETTSANERAAILEREEADPEIRAEVLELIEAARLEAEASSQLIESIRVTDPIVPEQIGSLRVLSLLGSGGFGVVYSAVRRVNDVEQRVAVKLFHAHRLGPDARRRFEREQRMLASLNHPGIVRFLDSGFSPDGRPYLVMEEVEGAPIAEHCDRCRLGIEGRLRLVADVCQALQHAHRRLIVHLDLKPSNILVTPDGQAKILDFGTAKLMDDTGSPTVTQQLTPLYASPERLRGEAGSVSCDVYSLGLVLCELLTGARPFGEGSSVFTAIADRAQGARSARPLAELINPEAAALRGVDAGRLRKALSGDLQAICSKALAHEPAERYASISGLLEDIRRYLAGEPVLAHPPGVRYRVRKFVSRNFRLLASAAVTLALLAGAAAYAWRERLQSVQRMEEARAMAKYLLFDLYDRVNELHGSTAVRAHMAGQAQTHLDRLAHVGGASIELQLEAAAGYNRLAEIQGVSGSSNVGVTEAAAVNLRKGRSLIDGLLAGQPNHPGALVERARNSLLSAKLQNWNRRNTKAARPLIEQARRDLEQTRNPVDPNWRRAYASLAVQEADLAEFDRDFAAEARIAAEGLSSLDQWPPASREELDCVLRRSALLKRRGNAAYYQDNFAEALTAYRESRDLLTKFDSQHPNRPEVLYALMDMTYQMAYCFGELKQPRAMLATTRDSLAIAARLMDYDRENEALRRAYWNKRQALAESLAALRHFGEALEEQEQVLRAREQARRAQPDSNLALEDVLVTEATLAGMLEKAGRRVRACSLGRQTLADSRKLHASGGMTRKNFAGQEHILAGVLRNCPPQARSPGGQ